MKLLVDLGNTRLKVAASDSGSVDLLLNEKHGKNLTHKPLNQVKSNIDYGKLDGVYLASVAEVAITREVQDNLAKLFGVPIKIATTPSNVCGLENAYLPPESLGIDRWLALVSASDQYPSPTCVVDCGTAVTIDSIDRNGTFIGGLILPGLGLMRSSLSKNTQAVDKYKLLERKEYFPKNTSIAVTAGTGLAIAAVIEKCIKKLEATSSEKATCVITGGDAEIVQSYMDVSSIHQPNLVLHGLAKYFRSS